MNNYLYKIVKKLIKQGLILTLLIGPIAPVIPVGPVDIDGPVNPVGSVNFNKPVNPLNFAASIGLVFGLGNTKATIVTKNAKNITQTSASLRAEITDTGRSSDLEAWFKYGTTNSYGKTSHKKYNIKKKGDIAISLYNLSPCTLYHFRAVVENDSGISYGADKTFRTDCPSFNIRMSVKNLSRGDTIWYKSLKANPSDQLLFKIEVGKKEGAKVENIMARANLASKISYGGSLKIDDNPQTKNICSQAINVGDLSEKKLITITFKGKVFSENSFSQVQNNLISTVLAYTTQTSNNDDCKVIITMGSATGDATQINTGITDGILDSILFPLGIALLIIWIFRSKLIGLDKLIEQRKKEITEYRAKKKLKKKINQIRHRIF